MSYSEALSRRSICITISESPDHALLGFGPEHLDDAMAEIARHLLAKGCRLLYGGDLRPGGFTKLLFELVSRYRRDADVGDERSGVANILAWPVHLEISAEALSALRRELSGTAEVLCLDVAGTVMSDAERDALVTRKPSADEWQVGLTAMRRWTTSRADARVALGGKTSQFKGRMPGVAEEVLLSLETGKPVFLMGGFGGCVADLCHSVGLLPDVQPRDWPGRHEFAGYSRDSLQNGLSSEDNAALASTRHIDQAVTLILRGLLELECRS